MSRRETAASAFGVTGAVLFWTATFLEAWWAGELPVGLGRALLLVGVLCAAIAGFLTRRGHREVLRSSRIYPAREITAVLLFVSVALAWFAWFITDERMKTITICVAFVLFIATGIAARRLEGSATFVR